MTITNQDYINSLNTRIEILQGQIDMVKETGEENEFGVSAKDQIKVWEKLIKKAEKQIIELK